MITDRLIALIDAHAEDLTTSWIEMLQDNENITFVKTIDTASLAELSHFIYDQLKLWLDWRSTSREVAPLFWELGAERNSEGVPLSEIHYSLILARRNLYINLLEKMDEEEHVSMNDVLTFTSRINYFFDKATYYLTRGYEGSRQPTEEDTTVLENILTTFRSGSDQPE